MDSNLLFQQIQALTNRERIKLIQKLWVTYPQDIEDLTWLAFSVNPETNVAGGESFHDGEQH